MNLDRLFFAATYSTIELSDPGSSGVDCDRGAPVSDLPAGMTVDDVEMVLRYNNDVVNYSAVGSSGAMWMATVSFDGNPPVEMLVDNKLNRIYLQVFAKIEPGQVDQALTTVGPYGAVGVSKLGDMFILRSAVLIEESTVHALTNALRGVALAYLALARS